MIQNIKTCVLVLLFLIYLQLSLGAPKDLLPPPEQEFDESEADEYGEEVTRGIKGLGVNAAMGQVQKSTSKCNHAGTDPIQDECSKYTDCARKDALPQIKFCIQGKFFDHKRRMCIKTADAQCKNVCPVNGVKFADPDNKHGFLMCLNGIPAKRNCRKPTMVWETSLDRCKDP